MKKGQDILVSLPGLKIIHHKVPGKELGSHCHDEHEFFLPLSGEIKIGFEEREVAAGPGSMLYVPPKIHHRFSSSTSGTGERVIWLISDQLWTKHVKKKFEITCFCTNSLAKELLFYLLLKRELSGEKYFISALIEALNDSLESAQIAQTQIELAHLLGKIEDIRIVKSMKMMNVKLGSDSLSEIAKKSGMSLRNFNRLFLKEVNMTPKVYIQLKRMEKAKELIRTTDKTITDISLDVGYNYVSKFIEAFKNMEGKLPSDFRNEKK